MNDASTNPRNATEIAGLSFESAIKELEDIVRRLESGQGALESAITDYERGTALKEHCLKTLENARLRVEKIMGGPDGVLRAEPFDAA